MVASVCSVSAASLRDELPVPSAPVLLGQRDERAVPGGPRRAPGVGEQHQREQPGGLRVVGQQPAQQAGQPDSLAGQVGALQVLAGRGRVSLVEHQVQDLLHRPQARLAVAGPGAVNRAPAARICCLARLIRCAIVASGTPNARAISAVVSPPTARRVSATCDDGLQRRVAAQEQQDECVVVIARGVGAAGVAAGVGRARGKLRERRGVEHRVLAAPPR